MSQNPGSNGNPGPMQKPARRRGVVSGSIIAGLLVFVSIFALLYVVIAGAIGFGMLITLSLVPAILTSCALSFWDAAADIAAAIGEMILGILATIAAVFAAIFSIFS